MNTPSHFLMTAAIDKALPQVPIHHKAFLLGSIAPDVPLWILSVSGMVYYHFMLGWTLQETFRVMFVELYFHNPFWLIFHNLLNAPLLLFLAIACVWQKRHNIETRYRWFFWFFVACLFHSIVDICTHADDGPLLLFPLDWSMRFHSPIRIVSQRF